MLGQYILVSQLSSRYIMLVTELKNKIMEKTLAESLKNLDRPNEYISKLQELRISNKTDYIITFI